MRRHFDRLISDVAMPAIRARGDDLQRIALISAGQRGNRLWHGGGEKERAAAIRRRVQYFFQFLTKTHVEHFVGFVENHGSQCACAKFAAFQMVAQTAWRTNDDMRALRQDRKLAGEGKSVYIWFDIRGRPILK